MKSRVYFFILTSIILACCNYSKDTIKNESIKNQLFEFEKAAQGRYSTIKSKDTVLLKLYKQPRFYKVELDYKTPSTYKDIYCIIEEKNQLVFVYSDSNLEKFFKVEKPFTPDTSIYKINYSNSGEIDWYSDLLYFDGTNFYNDSSSIK
jgi:hypothetical protein